MQQLAVIFDVDGVLVDSYAAHFQSWRRLYGELGVEYSEAAFAADFGRTSRDILRRTLSDDLTDARVRELDAGKEAYYRDIIRESFPAMDGAAELIDALADDGFLLAIGSSGPPENVRLVLDKLPSGQRIAAVVTGADVTRGKPDPQVFQMAAERLGVPPARCAVVEDAIHGIEAARRAGMAAIALVGTSERAKFSAADLIVDSLRELSPARIRALIETV
ncbi:MAG TPA: HAD family phosphatase [Lacipirellulaceae bacterium]|jgi:beta-phosphoglucomutase